MTRAHFRQWEAVTFAGEGKPAQRRTVAIYRSPLSGEVLATVDGQTVPEAEAREVMEGADTLTKIFEKLARQEAAD